MNILRHIGIGLIVLIVVIGAAYWQALDGDLSRLSGMFGAIDLTPRPNLSAFGEASLIIQIHVVAAISALLLGVVQLVAPKGTLPHRTLGYVWALLMVITAFTAIFIRQINGGDFSFIHIFVPLTFLGLFGVIANARKMQTDKHRSAVMGLFFGALMLPGLFAFMPGRLMWQMAFGG